MKRNLILLLFSVLYLGACNDKPEIAPVDRNLSVDVYPNPFYDFVSLRVSPQDSEGAILRVFDLEGQQLMEEEVNQGNSRFTLDLQGKEAGIYYAVIQLGE